MGASYFQSGLFASAMTLSFCCHAAASSLPESSLSPEQLESSLRNEQDWDWIKVDSGEWVKGRVKTLHSQSVEFDSDHFGLIQIDWADVVYIQTNRPMSVMLDGGEIVLGRLATEGGGLLVGDRAIRFERVVGIASASPRERDLWSASVSIGINFRSGNVEQKDFNSKAVLKRRTVKNNTRITYTGNYSESNSVVVASNQTAGVTHDYRISHKWFIRAIQAEFYRDPFQNRDSEWTVGFGAGYQIFDTSNLDWSIAAGPGFQRTEYVNVGPGEERTVTTPAFLISTFYEQDLTDNIDLLLEYQATLTESKAGRAKHDFYSALDVDLTKRLDLRLASSWKRIENPQPNNDGITPEKDDFTVTLGLEFEI